MPAKGCHFHHTEEAKRKIVKALTGHQVSAETKRRISEKNKGRHFSPSTQFKMGHKVSAEVRRKVSEVQKGRKHSEETKRKMSHSHKLHPVWKGKKFSKQHRQRLRESHKGKPLSDDHLRHILKANAVKPNRAEQRLIHLIQGNNLPFKYVGDGEVIIHGKCPDFINNNGQKQLIELFGDYWHRNDSPQQRIDTFKRYGFDTLIIWEHELEHEDQVMDRINEFVGEIENGFKA